MNSLLAKARSFWSCLLWRKLNSLKSGKVVQVVVANDVAVLIGVDEEQAGPPETGSKAVQVIIAYGVVLVHGVDLVGVDDKQSGLPEEARTLCLEGIMNGLLAKA